MKVIVNTLSQTEYTVTLVLDKNLRAAILSLSRHLTAMPGASASSGLLNYFDVPLYTVKHIQKAIQGNDMGLISLLYAACQNENSMITSKVVNIHELSYFLRVLKNVSSGFNNRMQKALLLINVKVIEIPA